MAENHPLSFVPLFNLRPNGDAEREGDVRPRGGLSAPQPEE